MLPGVYVWAVGVKLPVLGTFCGAGGAGRGGRLAVFKSPEVALDVAGVGAAFGWLGVVPVLWSEEGAGALGAGVLLVDEPVPAIVAGVELVGVVPKTDE